MKKTTPRSPSRTLRPVPFVRPGSEPARPARTRRSPAGSVARRGRLAGALLGVAVLLASCDTVNPTEGIVLQEKTVAFRFEINTSEISPGETVVVESDDVVDLGPALEADGFTKAEVISASVTRVELERISPAGVDLSTFDQAQVALTASGASDRTIASSSSLPDDPSAVLSIGGNSDATSFVVASSFGGVLTFVPVTVPEGLLVMRVTVSFRVEVEGV